MRTGLARAVAALLFFIIAVPALAQDYCEALRSELGMLQAGNGGNAVNAELARLSQQLAALSQAADAQGCRRVLRLLNNATCDSLLAQVDSTRAQIDIVQRQSFMAADPNYRARRIADIEFSLDAANCPSPLGGRTTTVCVRLCDGYFFPIGYGSDESEYERDARLCMLRCPNQQTELFVRRGGDTPIAEAESAITGDAYIELANAFLYEADYNPACGCLPADGRVSIGMVGLGERFENRLTVAPPPSEDAVAERPSYPPIGPRRPEPSEDPSTVENRAGGLVATRLQLQPIASDTLVSDAGVRLVGPAFMYAQ